MSEGVYPTGLATQATLAAIDAKLGATLSVSGTVSISGSVAVTGTFWQATQPVSVASLPLPASAATSAKQDTGNTSLGNIDTKTPSLGQAAMASSSPVVIASDQSTVPMQSTIAGTVRNGQVTVAASGSEQPLSGSSVPIRQVIVQALSTNTGSVWVGDSSVTTGNGFELQPGQATGIEIDNLNKVYVDATTSGDKVCFIGSST